MNSESLKRVLEQRDFYRRSFVPAVLNPLFSTAFKFNHANAELIVRIAFEVGHEPNILTSIALDKAEREPHVGTIIIDPRIRERKANQRTESLVNAYVDLRRKFEKETEADVANFNTDLVSFATLFYQVSKEKDQAKGRPVSISNVLQTTIRFYESNNGETALDEHSKEMLEFVLHTYHALEKPLAVSFKGQIELEGICHDLRVLFKKTPKRLKEVLADNTIHLDSENGKMVATIIIHPQIFKKPLWRLKDVATHEFVEVIYGFLEKENRNKSIFDKTGVLSAYFKWTLAGTINSEPAQQQDSDEEFESVEKTKRRLLVSDESLKDSFSKRGVKFPIESLEGLDSVINDIAGLFASGKSVDKNVVFQRISEFLKSNPT